MITVVNRDYCKKLIVQMPGQKHPAQYHKIKEETFNVLHGNLNISLDGKEQDHGPGNVVVVERGVVHEFSTDTGAVFEEISSTHAVDDSFYVDTSIMQNKARKTMVTHWLS